MCTAPTTFNSADGAGYDLQMGRWSRRLAGAFLDFVGTTDGERVLDVGCGTGSLCFAVAERSRNSEVHGIDLSDAYIEHATRINPYPKIAFEVGNACTLELPDQSFNRVLSLLVLHFVSRADQAVAEMRRVARPGSVVGAAVWDIRGGVIASRLFYDTAAVLDPEAKVHRNRNYTRPLTRPGELGTAWRSAGFRDVVETTLSIRMVFASFDDFWAPYLGKDGPGAEYVASLPNSKRAHLRDAVRSAFLDGEADGPRSFAATAWAVKGVA